MSQLNCIKQTIDLDLYWVTQYVLSSLWYLRFLYYYISTHTYCPVMYIYVNNANWAERSTV